MTTIERLTTWNEFEQAPDPDNGKLELHDGEVVLVPPASPRHMRIASRIVELLRRGYPHLVVEREFPYRPDPEMQFWYADVAAVTAGHWEQEAWTPGLVPEIVVEVVSPSNREAKLQRQRILTLANGGREFWQVEPEMEAVLVTSADGKTRLYTRDDMLVGERVAGIFR